MQATPTLLADVAERGRSILPRMSLLVGGEALPGELARALQAQGTQPSINLYGPTETTIWSASMTSRAAGCGGAADRSSDLEHAGLRAGRA